MIKFLLLPLLWCLGAAGIVQANPFDHFDGHHRGMPRGFEVRQLNTIDAIKRQGEDDEYVVLRGRLTKYYGDEKYEFTDLSGDTIEVKLDDDEDWSYIAKDQLIDILGKLDVDLFSLEVDVKRALPVADVFDKAPEP